MTEGYDCINDYIGKETYSYNAWGQLVNYNNDVGETASYTYYSDGLRASKTIGDNTTKYYYDGDNVINETLNNNNYATNVMGVNGYVSRRQNGTTGYLLKMHMVMYFLFTQVQAIKPLIIHMMRGEKYEQKMNQVLLKIIHYATMVNITIMKVI